MLIFIPRAKGHRSLWGEMTSFRGGIYNGNILPCTSRSNEDKNYRVDVDVTLLNRVIHPVGLHLMPFKPRHHKNTVKGSTQLKNLKLITTQKHVETVRKHHRPLSFCAGLRLRILHCDRPRELADTRPRGEIRQNISANEVIHRD